MRNTNLIENTGVIHRKSDGAFLGSCFLFRYPEILLTAAHCVGGYKPDDIEIRLPGSRTKLSFTAIDIYTLDKSDIAIIRIKDLDERDITWLIDQIFNDMSYGQDFAIFGYPQEYLNGQAAPTPRVFKGYIQRFFHHESYLGCCYLAAELSIGCPGGLSGAPVIHPKFHGRLYGVVTENLKTSTELESVIEVDDKGNRYKESFHNIINYGIALWLPSVAWWIDSIVPPVSHEEIQRRGRNQELWRDS